MIIYILTICPDMFGDFLRTPVIARAQNAGLLQVNIVDIRDYADGCYRKVDDSPYGGGAGMLIRCEPVYRALEKLARERPEDSARRVIALTPAGKHYVQADARRFAQLDELVLLCGHYEGFDERIYGYADESISIGDYVLTGGELPAMVIADSVARLLPGNIKAASLQEESFDDDLLEYPQYTRPYEFMGQKVPDILLSGNHEAIRRWRRERALEKTEIMTSEERES